MAEMLNQETPLFDTVQLSLRPPCAAGKKLLTDSAFQKDHRLVVEGTATHAGLIINRRCYRPYRVKDAARSMYDPKPIPIVEGHYPVDMAAKDDCRGVGTIQLAQYIDTRRGRPEDMVVTKWDKDPHLGSLGHLRYWGFIDDAEAIPRVLDMRLNRQSVGFYTDAMCDSITGADLYKLEWDDWPEHIREWRDEVDGKPVYLIPGQLCYYHLAFTDEPADPWAGVDAFKATPREVQETHGTFQIYAQDSGDGLIYDMASPEAVKHFQRPMWALGFDFEQRRQAEMDRIRQHKISAASQTGSPQKQEPGTEPARGMSEGDSQAAPELEDAPQGASHTDTGASEDSETVPAPLAAGNTAGSEGDREVPQNSSDEEATMDKILEQIRQLGKGDGQVMADLIKALGVTDEQLRALEPVAKLLKTDSEAAELARTQAVDAVKNEAQAQIARLSGELKAATDQVAEFKQKRKNQAVDRLFEAQKALGIIKPAEFDSEEKVKALKDELARQSTDALEFSLGSLERLRGGGSGSDTASGSVVPKQTQTRGTEGDDANTPRFLKISG